MIGAVDKNKQELGGSGEGLRFKQVVREGLAEKVALEYRCKGREGVSPVGHELREYEITGTASAKALRWDRVWHVGGTSKGPAVWRQSELRRGS